VVQELSRSQFPWPSLTEPLTFSTSSMSRGSAVD